jgi:hypothetical protein
VHVKGNRRILALAACVALVASVPAAAALVGRSSSELASARKATARFLDVDAAVSAGYGELRDAKKIACIALPGEGGMGIHYVNEKRVGDARLDPRKPEALVYERRGGSLRLVALEYVVFEKAWKQRTPPAMFGRTFDYVPAGNRYGLPPFWALHAWVWKQNPAGALMAWNPRVSCG